MRSSPRYSHFLVSVLRAHTSVSFAPRDLSFPFQVLLLSGVGAQRGRLVRAEFWLGRCMDPGQSCRGQIPERKEREKRERVRKGDSKRCQTRVSFPSALLSSPRCDAERTRLVLAKSRQNSNSIERFDDRVFPAIHMMKRVITLKNSRSPAMSSTS